MGLDSPVCYAPQWEYWSTLAKNCKPDSHLHIDVAPHISFAFALKYCCLESPPGSVLVDPTVLIPILSHRRRFPRWKL